MVGFVNDVDVGFDFDLNCLIEVHCLIGIGCPQTVDGNRFVVGHEFCCYLGANFAFDNFDALDFADCSDLIGDYLMGVAWTAESPEYLKELLLGQGHDYCSDEGGVVADVVVVDEACHKLGWDYHIYRGMAQSHLNSIE